MRIGKGDMTNLLMGKNGDLGGGEFHKILL